PEVSVGVTLEPERVLEDEEVLATVELRSAVPLERLDLVMAMPEGLERAGGKNPIGLRLAAGEPPRRVELPLRCARWGGYAVGELALRARDPVGLFSYEAQVAASAPLRVFP